MIKKNLFVEINNMYYLIPIVITVLIYLFPPPKPNITSEQSAIIASIMLSPLFPIIWVAGKINDKIKRDNIADIYKKRTISMVL